MEHVDILIFQFLDGQISEEDEVKLNAWKAEKPENAAYFSRMSGIYEHIDAVDFTIEPDTEHEWKKLKNQLPQKVFSIQTSTRRFPIGQLSAIAAAVLLLITLGWFIYQNLNPVQTNFDQTYLAELGKDEQIQLKDGSSIILAAGSQLRIRSDFGQSDRFVRLVGEAFFRVQSDADRPFVVETGVVQTKVLGTSFLLSAYANLLTVDLSVSEGLVGFYSTDGRGVEVSSGQASRMNIKSDVIEEMNYDEQRTLALENGKIVFSEDRLDMVLGTLERKFAIEIDDQSGLANRTFTSTFDRSESIESILQVIGLTFGLKTEVNGNHIRIFKSQ